MIAAIMISPILFTTSNNFRVIIPNNIFQEKQKVWNGETHQTKTNNVKTNFWKTIVLTGIIASPA